MAQPACLTSGNADELREMAAGTGVLCQPNRVLSCSNAMREEMVSARRFWTVSVLWTSPMMRVHSAWCWSWTRRVNLVTIMAEPSGG